MFLFPKRLVFNTHVPDSTVTSMPLACRPPQAPTWHWTRL